MTKLNEQSLRTAKRLALASIDRVLILTLLLAMLLLAMNTISWAAEVNVAGKFHSDVEPLLKKYCYECHGDGESRAEVAFDRFKSDEALQENKELWWKALKQMRAGLMPPRESDRPSKEQLQQIETWIKASVFAIDPKNLDPGRVTIRRLNRIEYRNTIRDLMGVEFNTDAEFPTDDSGFGFDNIGDVLTISPLLLEKYLGAAKTIVNEAVPKVSRFVVEKKIPGNRFRLVDPKGDTPATTGVRGGNNRESPLELSYYKEATAKTTFVAEHAGKYQVVLDFTANEKFVDNMFDLNKCQLSFSIDDKTVLEREYVRQEGRASHFEFDQEWQSGNHEFALKVVPLTPDEKQIRSLAIRVQAVTVRGPMEKKYWTTPKGYERFFPHEASNDPDQRRLFASELLKDFATKAFRRPVDDETVARLVGLAESVYKQTDQTFEKGIAQGMTAVLASSRFLFREEGVESAGAGDHPLIDEYALAARLSYFFWSSMPDEELSRLAAAGKLRENLSTQVTRMMADAKSREWIRNFTGQWLQARDIESVIINANAVVARDRAPDLEADKRRERFRALRSKPPESLTDAEKAEMEAMRGTLFGGNRRGRIELNEELRRAMRQETEQTFAYIVHENRSLLELIESDYTFLNEKLAAHYGIEGVQGTDMRRVALPAGSPRGGVLTQGTVLAITSNPDRTSPVKRGLFILENILGTPAAPPPPDIPPLEDAGKKFEGRNPTLRETLALHREKALCSSCHDSLDPPGLALENFNALGIFREKDRGELIDASSTLITGEAFKNIQELKHILATQHQQEFYRCLTEKLLIYALGRGLDYHDVQTVDTIVAQLEKENGSPQALVQGIINSPAFQKRRLQNNVETSHIVRPEK